MNTRLPDTTYLESRLTLFSALADNAYASSWRKFWLSQVEAIREELKMSNPAIKSLEREANHADQ